MSRAKLKKALLALEEGRDVAQDLERDPLRFTHRYQSSLDQEVSGVIASCLAYGRVSMFGPVIAALLDIADKHGGPTKWVTTFSQAKADEIRHIKYRLNTSRDIILLIWTLQEVIQRYSSIGQVFLSNYKTKERDLQHCLNKSIGVFRKIAVAISEKENILADEFAHLPNGFRFFFPRPETGSACKRWNLFLRWMIRPTPPDLGLWKIPPAKLRIPLDAHVLSISQMIGLTKRKSADGKTVDEITMGLRQLDRLDPIRFDFSISHLGISGDCKKKYIKNICQPCPLVAICIHTRRQHANKRT